MNGFTSVFGPARRILCVGLFAFSSLAGAFEYEAPEVFLARVFSNEVPAPKSMWITGELKEQVSEILQHPPNSLRTRYWLAGSRSAWILDEIGKTEPITVGVVVDGGEIVETTVLAFRESRGWEVRERFFLKQFDGAMLEDDAQLDRHIDGISGATLSVRALKKIARLALLFDRQLRQTAPRE